jgi:hypothetical protein
VATAWADTVEGDGSGSQLYDRAGVVDLVDDQSRQLREQDGGKITNARSVTITDPRPSPERDTPRRPPLLSQSRLLDRPHVRQLDAVASRLLARLCAAALLLPGRDRLAYLDIDNTIRGTYGRVCQAGRRARQFCTQVGHPGPLRTSESGRPIPYLDDVALDFPELTIVAGHNRIPVGQPK